MMRDTIIVAFLLCSCGPHLDSSMSDSGQLEKTITLEQQVLAELVVDRRAWPLYGRDRGGAASRAFVFGAGRDGKR